MSRLRSMSPAARTAIRPLSRRGFLGASLATSAGLALSACGAGQSAPGTAASSAAGPWSFTDDRGQTVTLDRIPTRIAGLTDQIAALWNLTEIVPVAAFGYTPMATDVSFTGKDLSPVSETGSTYGEIDLEKLAAAAPELIVTTVYPTTARAQITPETLCYGFKDLEQQAKVAKIAPIVAIAQRGSAAEVIERNVALAAALGVDTGRGRVAEAKAEFEAAGKALSAAAAKGLSVLAMAAYVSEGLYVARSSDDPALKHYASLGLNYPQLKGTNYFWDQLSWENADTYRTDVVLNSLRAMKTDELVKQPTFKTMPAAKAGQIFDWKFQPMDYAAQASFMRELAGHLERSRKVT